MSCVPLIFELGEDERLVMDAARRFAGTLKSQMRESESNGLSGDLQRDYEALELTRLHWPESLGGSEMGMRLKLQTLSELAIADAAATLALEWRSWSRFSVATHAPELALDRTAAVAVDVDERLTVDDNGLQGKWAYLPVLDPTNLYVLKGTKLHLACDSQLSSAPVKAGALHAAGGCSVELSGSRRMELSVEAASQLSAHWRLFFGALLSGLSRAAYAHAREYCLERTTFGKKVAHHQGVAFILADMLVAVESSNLMLERVGVLLDTEGWGANAVEYAESAYLQAVEGALFVSTNAVQLLGAAGYVSDHPVEKWMREARALSVLCGGVDASRENAALFLDPVS